MTFAAKLRAPETLEALTAGLRRHQCQTSGEQQNGRGELNEGTPAHDSSGGRRRATNSSVQ